MKKKLSALFMVFAMVLSLFSGLGVNTIWADVNEEEGGAKKALPSSCHLLHPNAARKPPP